MDQVLIRLFAPEDTESLAELLFEMSVHYNGTNASKLDQVRENLVSSILGPDSGVRLVVAVNGVKVVAMAAISLLYPAPKETAQLFMKELYVLSGRRREGIGKAMMHWLSKYAIAHQCSRFDWTVDGSNSQAVGFYNELGAVRVQDKLYYRIAGGALLAFAIKTPVDDT